MLQPGTKVQIAFVKATPEQIARQIDKEGSNPYQMEPEFGEVISLFKEHDEKFGGDASYHVSVRTIYREPGVSEFMRDANSRIRTRLIAERDLIPL